MRVALVFQGLKPAEEAFSGIPWGMGNGLAELGHEPVFVRAAAPRSLERLEDVLAARVPGGDRFDSEFARLRSARARRRLAEAGAVDAVIQFATGFLLPPRPRLATFEDMTVVQAVRCDPAYAGMSERPYRAWVERQRACYERASLCFTLSAWTAASIAADYGVEGKAVPVGAGRNIDPAPVEREWWPPRFLFVGLDWKRKNGDGVLRAFRRLRETVPEATLSLVGEHPEVTEDGVSAHGRLSTRVPTQRRRLEQLFEQATCFVMPSFIEPFGIVYREAAAAGIPSIGTTAGGAPEAVGENGACVEPGDEEALLGAMRRFAQPDEAAEIGRRAAAGRECTTWRAVAANVTGAFESRGGGGG